MITDEYKSGTCRWCKAKGEVYADNDLCGSCDTRIIKCSICKTYQHEDRHCRHVFKDMNCEWAGSGAFSNEHVKKSFLKLLSRMPPGFVDDLRKAIRSGRFHTWVIAPIIGGGGVLELHGMPPHWGEDMRGLGEGEDAEELADGYRWLASLYDRKTRGANSTTIAWTDEWKARL